VTVGVFNGTGAAGNGDFRETGNPDEALSGGMLTPGVVMVCFPDERGSTGFLAILMDNAAISSGVG